MSVKIITDSTADLSPALKSSLTVVPLTIRFGVEEYIDGVTIDHKQFYEKLIECDDMPQTSQANIGDFEEIFEKITKQGDDAVVITISSKLSGTHHSASVAAEDFKGDIFVIDSENVSIGTGVLVELACRLATEGKPAAEIASLLEKAKREVEVIAMFDSLEYLKKGGRISKTAAVAGALLSIKPVISIKDGEVAIVGKARGSKQANNHLSTHIETSGGIDFSRPLILGYTGLSDHLLQKYIEDSAHLWKGQTDTLSIAPVGSVVGTHAGPGAIAVAYFRKQP